MKNFQMQLPSQKTLLRHPSNMLAFNFSFVSCGRKSFKNSPKYCKQVFSINNVYLALVSQKVIWLQCFNQYNTIINTYSKLSTFSELADYTFFFYQEKRNM